MALDEPQENDEIFDDNGITYIINRQLFEQTKPIHVDFITTHMGSEFSISSNMSRNSLCASGCSC